MHDPIAGPVQEWIGNLSPRRPMNRPLTASQVWRMPVLLSVVSAVGLISALLGDGSWDVVSWVALGAQVGVILWYIVRSRSRHLASSGSLP
jgi:hypothetical protein